MTKQNTIITREIITVRYLNPKIKPNNLPSNVNDTIKNANKWAYCLTKALNDRLNSIWNSTDKKQIMVAWNNQKWDSESFFYLQFGKAQNFNCIKIVKKHIPRNI